MRQQTMTTRRVDTVVSETFFIVYSGFQIQISVYGPEYVARIRQVQPLPKCELCGHECQAAIVDVGAHIYCAWHVPQFAEADVSASLDYLTHQPTGRWQIILNNPPD